MARKLDPNYEFSPDGVVLPSADAVMHEAWISPGLGARIVDQPTYAQDGYWSGTPWADYVDRPKERGLGSVRIARGLRRVHRQKGAVPIPTPTGMDWGYSVPVAQHAAPAWRPAPKRRRHFRGGRPRVGTLQGLGAESTAVQQGKSLLSAVSAVVQSWDAFVAYLRSNFGAESAASYGAINATLKQYGDMADPGKTATKYAIEAYSRVNTWIRVARDLLMTHGAALEKEDPQLVTDIGSWINDFTEKHNALAPVAMKSPLWAGIKTFGSELWARVQNLVGDPLGPQGPLGGGGGTVIALLVLAGIFMMSRKGKGR